MGSRLTYTGDKKDESIIDLCQKLIISCLPEYKQINFPQPKEKVYFFEGLTSEQIQSAFASKKMELHLLLEILQRCNIAYNEPYLLKFIESLLHDKTFFFLTKKGVAKRIMTKKIIDKALRKHLLEVLPKEFRFLVNDSYFLKYINELFLPLEKGRIITTIEKFFEISLFEKNSLYNKLDINYNEYEMARCWINKYRIKYQNTLEKYKNDPEYQTIEKIQSVIKEVKKNKPKVEEDKIFDYTMDDIIEDDN